MKQNSEIAAIMRKSEKGKQLKIGKKYANQCDDPEENFFRKERILNELMMRIPPNLSFQEYEMKLIEKENPNLVVNSIS